jgi:glycosyltransferase involved in cell wall biosynthesis
MENEKKIFTRTPYFSILTVTRNAQKTIQETLTGIRNQSFKDFEFIVIDGASSDKTLQILHENEDMIDQLITEKDEGLYFAMNKGLQLCTGKYIGIINADDFYDTDTLEIVHSATSVSISPYIVYSPMKIIGSKRIVDISHEELNERMIPHPSCFVPREFYISYGLFDTRLKVAADYELMLRFRHKNLPFKKISQPIVNYREGGLSSKNTRISILETLRIQEQYAGSTYFGIFPKFLFIYLKTNLRNFLSGINFRFLESKQL